MDDLILQRFKNNEVGYFELIGVVLIIVILGLSWIVRDFGNDVHDLDDAVFESRLERTELQYYDLVLDCHDPTFMELGDAVVNDLCNKQLPQVYNEYRQLIKEAEERK